MIFKDLAGAVYDLDPAKIFVSCPSAGDCARNPELNRESARVLRLGDLTLICIVSIDVMESIYAEQRKVRVRSGSAGGRGEGDGIRADPTLGGFSREAYSGLKGRRGR